MLLAFTLGTFLWAACSKPRTVITTTTYFPSNATWDSALFRVVVEARGEAGAPYTKRGQKEVAVAVWDQTKIQTNRQYSINAGDLVWTVAWTNLEDVKMTFFEKLNGEKRQLTTIALSIDTNTLAIQERVSPSPATQR